MVKRTVENDDMGKQTGEVTRLLTERLGRKITREALQYRVRRGDIPEPHRLPGCGQYLWSSLDIERAYAVLSGEKPAA